MLTHAGLLEAFSELCILSLVPQTSPAISLALLHVRVARFVRLEELRNIGGVVLGHGGSAKG